MNLPKTSEMDDCTKIPSILVGVAGEYFVAEELSRRGFIDSMDLQKNEESKIECARKSFAKITTDQVKCDVVNNYGKLMELVK